MHMVGSGRKKRRAHHTRHHDLSNRSSVVLSFTTGIVVVCTEDFRANPKRRKCHQHDVVQVSTGILEVGQSQIPQSPT